MNKRLTWSVLWLAVVTAAQLAIGSCQAREAYLTRGIPAQLVGPIAHAGVALGVNVELEQYDDAALAIQLATIAASPSIRSVKQSFYYSEQFDWAAADRIVAAVAESDLQLVALLDGDASAEFPPPNLSGFGNWTAEFAQRYADHIDYYIIWDEPNLASHWGGQKVNPDQYAALLSVASSAIRASDAVSYIIAAPLAPTTETDTVNMADWLYLQKLYEAEAEFDVVASKPYGFDNAPDDRQAHSEVLNFSRAILLREVMLRNGDENTAIWAGNWGWNALPSDWSGAPSIWGDVSKDEQALYTQAALDRAQREWPWMGTMFLENWQPNSAENDPRWGFSIANSDTANVVVANDAAYSGFHFASNTDPAMQWTGDWTFSPEFGADSSEKYVENGDVRDSVRFTFWGTAVGLRVRRADFRARFYVTVDGQPANARPSDEFSTTVVLDAPNPNEDYITIEPVATNLTPGQHTLEIVAHRGWNQFALNGFSVGYRPEITPPAIVWLLWSVVAIGSIFTIYNLRLTTVAQWGSLWEKGRAWFGRFSQRLQLLFISTLAAILGATGVLTWLQSAAGIFRRLGDSQQLALTLGTAAIFYVTPYFIIYIIALLCLILLISFRPAWGIALIALSIPFYYREQILKPIFDSYRFSPTELFVWATAAGLLLFWIADAQARTNVGNRRWLSADFAVLALLIVATVSLFFTERLDVATNEWRTVIVEGALFYALLRLTPMTEKTWSVVLDFFVLSGVIIALFGLGQVVFGFTDLITTGAGLRRVQSIYGSPNNVALYFGRILPLLIAVPLFGKTNAFSRRRRWLYGAVALLLGSIFLLTFSKGGLLIGLPIALFVIFAFWLQQQQRAVLPWFLAFLLFMVVGFITLLQIPQLAARLDLFGSTSFMRYRLWQASIEMIRERPWFGVGLDNFLYAHRGRYIFESAWEEPNLNHPHNFIFDFATRLGLLGLAIWIWLVVSFGRILHQLHKLRINPPLVIAATATLSYILAHGLVDHSFFLIDLAFSFFLWMGLSIWIFENQTKNNTNL